MLSSCEVKAQQAGSCMTPAAQAALHDAQLAGAEHLSWMQVCKSITAVLCRSSCIFLVTQADEDLRPQGTTRGLKVPVKFSNSPYGVCWASYNSYCCHQISTTSQANVFQTLRPADVQQCTAIVLQHQRWHTPGPHKPLTLLSQSFGEALAGPCVESGRQSLCTYHTRPRCTCSWHEMNHQQQQ